MLLLIALYGGIGELMLILLSSVSILGLVVGLLLNKKYFLNPISLFSILVGITHILSSMRLYNLIETTKTVYIMAIIGEIGVILGAFLANKSIIITVKKFKIKNLEKFSYLIKENKIFKLMIIFVFLFELYRLYTIYPLLVSGANLDYIRAVQFGQTINGINYNADFLYTYVCEPLIYLLIPICIICFCNQNTIIIKKRYCVIFFITLIIEALTSGGGRMILISFIIQVVIILYYIYKDQGIRFKVSKKMKRILFFIGIILIFFIIYMTLNRGNGELKIIKTLYYYFVGGIPNTGLHLNDFNNNYTYGLVFFSSLLRPVFLIMEYIFGFTSSLYEIAINIPTVLAENITNIGNGEFNSFVTIFYYFYHDGGYIAVFLCSIIYGYFIQKIMKNYLLHKNYEYLVLLILIFTSITYVTIRYSYIYIYNFMSLIYWYFCFKLLKIKII